MKLVVDHREVALREHLADVAVDWRLLDLGDVVIEAGDGTALLVMERKSIKDLAASIKDGRYRAQKDKLMSSYNRDALCYIIEGKLSFADNTGILVSGIGMDALHSCVLNTALRDKIRVFQTSDAKDTCDLIQQIFKRYSRDPNAYTVDGGEKGGSELHVPKCRNGTQEECFVAQLCQVPGVSTKTAQAIVEVHKSIATLVDILKVEGAGALSQIKTESNGKKRALSKTVIDNLVSYMT